MPKDAPPIAPPAVSVEDNGKDSNEHTAQKGEDLSRCPLPPPLLASSPPPLGPRSSAHVHLHIVLLFGREYVKKEVVLSEVLQKSLRTFFDKMDSNKDGTVTKDEAIAFWGKNFAKVRSERARW